MSPVRIDHATGFGTGARRGFAPDRPWAIMPGVWILSRPIMPTSRFHARLTPARRRLLARLLDALLEADASDRDRFMDRLA